MRGKVGVAKSRLPGKRLLRLAVGLGLVVVAAALGATLFKPVPAGAPETAGQAGDKTRKERSASVPYLGMTYQELPARARGGSDLPAIDGAVVASIVPGSPAAMGGLSTGDVILAVDGEALGRENTLLNVLLRHTPGDKVRLMVQRGQEHLSLEVPVGKQ